MIYAVDFDGTIVKHAYPEVGEPVPGALDCLRELTASGHQIILWTMRSGKTLEAALLYLAGENIDVWGVNENPEQDWSESPKAYAHKYIDDAAMGCPLIFPSDMSRPFVDWRALFPDVGIQHRG